MFLTKHFSSNFSFYVSHSKTLTYLLSSIMPHLIKLTLQLSLTNSDFQVQPDNIILVHGERTGMGRLKSQLER